MFQEPLGRFGHSADACPNLVKIALNQVDALVHLGW